MKELSCGAKAVATRARSGKGTHSPPSAQHRPPVPHPHKNHLQPGRMCTFPFLTRRAFFSLLAVFCQKPYRSATIQYLNFVSTLLDATETAGHLAEQRNQAAAANGTAPPNRKHVEQGLLHPLAAPYTHTRIARIRNRVLPARR